MIENPTHVHVRSEGAGVHGGADAASCLTPPQVEAARKMYQPVVNAQTKQGDLPGPRLRQRAGLGDVRRASSRSASATQMFQYHGVQQPELGLQDAELRQRHGARSTRPRPGSSTRAIPNLKQFTARGGKLIQYHGWADPQIPAPSSTQYYQSVRRHDGRRRQGDGQLSAVHGAGHEPLRRRRRHGDVRHARRARAVGGEEAGAGPDPGVARGGRQGRAHASAVPAIRRWRPTRARAARTTRRTSSAK